MAFDNGMTPADIAALTKNSGGWGEQNGAWWIIILFLFAAMGGNGWGRPNAGPNPGYPLQADMQRGFDQNATQNALNNIAAQINNGFADASTARLNGQMNQQQNIFGLQTALQQTANANQSQTNNGMNGIVLGMQQMGNQTQQGIADLKYTVATENCNDRQTLNLGIRDLMAQNTANTNAIIQSQQQGFQGVQDKLCALQIENLKNENSQLRQQLNMANLVASQTAQTAYLTQNNAQQTQYIVNRVAPVPTPAYIVSNPYSTPSTSTTT